MLLDILQSKQLIHPPPWLSNATQYLCLMGSVAYGVAGNDSDSDIYGFCIPSKDMIFPHLAGIIPGFGKQIKKFEQYQEYHIKDDNKEYDFQIYNIVKFFNLLMLGTPNIIDALFVPQRCIIYNTFVGSMVKDNRKIFLHKGLFHRFRGYSFQQLHKIKIKNPEEGGKRKEIVDKFGYDTKFGYHLVRLLLECEQILTLHDLDLECNSEILKAIRRGEWTQEKVIEFFNQKEKALNETYEKSTLPYAPDEQKIKKLLLECLEHHFGSLENAYIEPDRYKNALKEIEGICYKLNLHK